VNPQGSDAERNLGETQFKDFVMGQFRGLCERECPPDGILVDSKGFLQNGRFVDGLRIRKIGLFRERGRENQHRKPLDEPSGCGYKEFCERVFQKCFDKVVL